MHNHVLLKMRNLYNKTVYYTMLKLLITLRFLAGTSSEVDGGSSSPE